ncbi:MAG TPA: ATP-dependent DNA helicase [Steroidobacteraceae bacterium]
MAEFSGIFDADGPLSRSLEGYRARPAQQQMASRIDAALAGREVLLVEAGTGTGKTFAYLVPALLSGLRVLISTGTRTLQDQLYHRDLPLLAAALGRPARVALLKGRSNYLCRARLQNIGRQGDVLPALADPLLAQVVDWSLRTRSGDLAELPELADAHPLRPQISSTRENCAGSRCAEYARCHVLEARHAALEADIVVVNHHLLLADLALKEDGFGELLPSVEAVILDEAHQLPDLVSEFFGISFASRQVEALLGDLRTELRAAGQEPGAAARWVAPLERALAACHASFGREERHLAWRELAPQHGACLEELEAALLECGARLCSLEGASALEQSAHRIETLCAALARLLDESEGPESAAGARTVTTHARGFLLRLLPYDVSGRFSALLAAHRSAWIFTSATLAVGEDFSHFASRLGLREAPALRFESPFDYRRQALLYLPRGLPQPSDPTFTAAVIATVRPLLAAAGGGAFLLFTSHRALREAARLLEAELPADWPLLVQGRAPREQLLRQFRASGRAVLLGAASFWEGVDVQGAALRLVLIDRLPFASPEDPVVRARIEHLQSQGANPFKDYQLPEAVLALKQGIGRLIRSEEDRGVVVVCDPRLSERSYGRVFRSSLPPMTVVREAAPALELLRELGTEQAPALAEPRSLPA